MFADFNKDTRKWKKNTEGFEYIKLRDYLEQTNAESITVWGYFINQLDNGKAVTIITDDCFINLPSHAVETFEKFGEAENNAIEAGKLMLTDFRKVTIKRFKQETIYFKYADK